jgi:hypothetical protein
MIAERVRFARALGVFIGLALAAAAPDALPIHVDPSTLALDELARIRGAMWSARLDVPFGPRPRRPDNVIATAYFDNYSPGDQTRIIAALKARGYTHVVAGPLVDTGGYHGQFHPHDWRGAAFDRFLDQLETFWDNGLAPIVFIHPDGWTFERTRDELTPLLRQERAERLIRIVVPTGWEPTRHGWSSCTWAAFAQWARQTLPNALVLIHTAAEADAPAGRDARCSDRDAISAWARVAPFIHGWLIQNGPYATTPQADPALARKFAAQFAANPARDSAWGAGIPIRLYAGEQTAYSSYWRNLPEAASRAWGDLAIASGADGYLDGGTVEVPRRR